MSELPQVLERASRCVLAFAGGRGPLVAPLAYWADGAALWMSTPAASVKTRALMEQPSCVAFVADPDDPAAGVVVRGSARIYGLHDPVGLAVHWPVVSAAMTALAGRNAASVFGYFQDASDVPRRFRPHNRVAVRVGIDAADAVRAPVPAPDAGPVPPLPAVVPADIRRALAGRRTVVAAVQETGGTIELGPAVWGQGYRLQLPRLRARSSPSGCAVFVGEDPRGRPTTVTGVCLTGTLDEDRFTPRRVTWWEGFTLRGADVPPSAPSLVLPD